MHIEVTWSQFEILGFAPYAGGALYLILNIQDSISFLHMGISFSPTLQIPIGDSKKFTTLILIKDG